jgi:outer membrane immunogenic protein
MKRLLFATVASLVTLSAARAADIVEPPAVYDWTGSYIGLQAGYGWDNVSVDLDESPALAADNAISGDRESVDDIDRDGFVGGAFAGYLLQSDSLVFGLEGDIEYADMDGSAKAVETAPSGEVLPVGRLDNDIDWLASLRLRAGFAMNRALIYATGGLAVGGTELDFSSAVDYIPDDSDHETSWGWTIGGGIEYAIADNLSIRAEYRYTDLGTLKVRALNSSLPDFYEDLEVDQTFHAVRGGLSWHFH